jgi:DNA topoisomerase VI subunit B
MDIVYKNTVQVPQEFFIKERDQSYSDWKEAFFRELFTNSVDAGATKIIVNISDTQEDKAYRVIEFLDNGSGMDSHVLENVYFHLGRSSRDNSSVGGFGRARILTNFSAAKYEIYTQNWKVEYGNLTKFNRRNFK